jgi:hypothetical protein
MELYRLAKKLPGLARTEKQTLIAIADAASMRDAECRKSKATIDRERGLAPRTFYNGIHGRKRKDGTEYFPGLLKRKVVFIKAGGYVEAGVPTIYGINVDVLRALANGTETSAQTSAQGEANLGTTESEPRHKTGVTSAQNGAHLGTNADKVPNEVPDKGTESRYPRERVPLSPAENPSPSGSPESARSGSEENHKPGGQGTPEDELLEKVLLRVKGLNARARFSKTSRAELRAVLVRLVRKVSWLDVDHAIQQTIRGCTDDVAFGLFGSTLAANLESDALAHRAAHKEAARKAAEAAPWHERITSFVESEKCGSLADIESWLSANPRDGKKYGRDDDGYSTVGLMDFYVNQAISHAWKKPELIREYKEREQIHSKQKHEAAV